MAFSVSVTARDPYLGKLADGQDAPTEGYFVREPWRSLYSPRFETLFVRLASDTGHVGWGEALSPIAPSVPARIVESMLAPTLVGRDPLAVRAASTALRELMRERGHLVGHQADALAAVDIALWDLAGQILGIPVVQLLGGGLRSEIPVYLSGLSAPTPDERATLAKEASAKGFKNFKIALGLGIAEDIKAFDAVADAVPDSRIGVDAHWAYSVPEALKLGMQLSDRDCWFLEAPLAPEDVEGHAQLGRTLPVPIAVGEALRNRFEFADWIDRRAVHLCQPDIARTGITEGIAIALYASAHHLPVAPHHSVGLGVSLAAGLHLASAIENLQVFEYQPATLDIANSMLETPIRVGPRGLTVPEGPGLGVSVKEDVISSWTTE